MSLWYEVRAIWIYFRWTFATAATHFPYLNANYSCQARAKMLLFTSCINQLYHLPSIRILNRAQIERTQTKKIRLFDPKHTMGVFSLFRGPRKRKGNWKEREKILQFSIWHHLANRFRRSGFYFYLFARQRPSSIHGITLVIYKFHGISFSVWVLYCFAFACTKQITFDSKIRWQMNLNYLDGTIVNSMPSKSV